MINFRKQNKNGSMKNKISKTTVDYWQNRLNLNIYVNNLKKQVTYTDEVPQYGFKQGVSYTFLEFVQMCRAIIKKGGKSGYK